MTTIQANVRNIFISGIKGIQTVKIGKRIILNVN